MVKLTWGLILLSVCRALLAAEPAPALVEFELLAPQAKPAYVRQQLLARARLYVRPNVLSTSYSDPVAPGALVEQLGEAEVSEVARDGVSYQRIERRYALFPLRAGELRVQAPVFQGGLSLRPGPALPFGGRLPIGAIRELRASADGLRLRILAPPPEQAAHWLPAQSLALTETLEPAAEFYGAGESIVRSIELQAEGQPHAQLPQIDAVFPEGLKVYADPPEGKSIEGPRGLTAKQVWRWALVPTREGEFELPAVQLRWWDVSAGRERVAQIAARRIQVSASATAAPSAAMAPVGEASDGFWPGVAGAAGLGWLLTAGAWFVSRRRNARASGARPQADEQLAVRRSRLQQALREADAAATRAALIEWAQKRFADSSIVSLDAVAAASGSQVLAHELGRLDRALYRGGAAWNAQALADALAWGRPDTRESPKTQALRPLYPEGREPLLPEAPPVRPLASRLLFALLALAALAGVAQTLLMPRMKPAAAALIAGDYRALVRKQEDSVLDFLRAFEAIQDQVHPDRVPRQQQQLKAAFGERLAALATDLDRVAPPEELAGFHRSWRNAIERLLQAQRSFSDAEAEEFLTAFFDSRRAFVDAAYELYALGSQLQRVAEYWVLPDALASSVEAQHTPISTEPIGFTHREAGPGRSAYSLYVPENYDPRRRWPLIVSLHGSHGTARSSLLTWLRAAKSRGYLVLAPQSAEQSWSVEDPEHDAARILAALDEVAAQYAVDRRRIFVTGLSDGGTFSYALGLRCPDLFAGIAPVAGVLPPSWPLAAAAKLPVLIVHGAQDHIFPVQAARAAYAALAAAGFAQLSLRELPEWGHGFPYAVNEGPVLRWLEDKSRASEGSCQ